MRIVFSLFRCRQQQNDLGKVTHLIRPYKFDDDDVIQKKCESEMLRHLSWVFRLRT